MSSRCLALNYHVLNWQLGHWDGIGPFFLSLFPNTTALYGCLPSYLSPFLSVSLPISLPSYLSPFLSVSLHTCLPSYLSPFLNVSPPALCLPYDILSNFISSIVSPVKSFVAHFLFLSLLLLCLILCLPTTTLCLPLCLSTWTVTLPLSCFMCIVHCTCLYFVSPSHMPPPLSLRYSLGPFD